jgi:hypothetical protein
MKRILSCLLSFLLVWPACASITVVQTVAPASSSCGSTSGTTCVFSPSATRAGDTLVAAVWWAGTTSMVTPPTGWTADSNSLVTQTGSGNNHLLQFFYITNASSVSKVSFSINTSADFNCGVMFELSSTNGAGWPARDTSNNKYSTASGTTNTGPSLTLNGTEDAILQAAVFNNISSAGSGYSLLKCNGQTPYGSAYETNASSGGPMTWTSTSTDSLWLMSAEAFCDSGSGSCSSSSPTGVPLIVELFDSLRDPWSALRFISRLMPT